MLLGSDNVVLPPTSTVKVCDRRELTFTIVLCVLNILKMELSKELYLLIDEECKKFDKEKGYDLDIKDVLHSYFYSTKDVFHILYDWDELEQKEIVPFLKDMIIKIDNYYT